MCVCLCGYTCAYACVCLCVYLCVCVCTHVHICVLWSIVEVNTQSQVLILSSLVQEKASSAVCCCVHQASWPESFWRVPDLLFPSPQRDVLGLQRPLRCNGHPRKPARTSLPCEVVLALSHTSLCEHNECYFQRALLYQSPFLCALGIWTQVVRLVRQALYPLNHGGWQFHLR